MAGRIPRQAARERISFHFSLSSSCSTRKQFSVDRQSEFQVHADSSTFFRMKISFFDAPVALSQKRSQNKLSNEPSETCRTAEAWHGQLLSMFINRWNSIIPFCGCLFKINFLCKFVSTAPTHAAHFFEVVNSLLWKVKWNPESDAKEKRKSRDKLGIGHSLPFLSMIEVNAAVKSLYFHSSLASSVQTKSTHRVCLLLLSLSPLSQVMATNHRFSTPTGHRRNNQQPMINANR